MVTVIGDRLQRSVDSYIHTTNLLVTSHGISILKSLLWHPAFLLLLTCPTPLSMDGTFQSHTCLSPTRVFGNTSPIVDLSDKLGIKIPPFCPSLDNSNKSYKVSIRNLYGSDTACHDGPGNSSLCFQSLHKALNHLFVVPLFLLEIKNLRSNMVIAIIVIEISCENKQIMCIWIIFSESLHLSKNLYKIPYTIIRSIKWWDVQQNSIDIKKGKGGDCNRIHYDTDKHLKMIKIPNNIQNCKPKLLWWTICLLKMKTHAPVLIWYRWFMSTHVSRSFPGTPRAVF